MYIVTDDKIYTESLFSECLDWSNLGNNRLSYQIGPLAKSILNGNAYVCSNMRDFEGWDFLIISKYSKISQFDALNQHLSENELDLNVLLIAGSGEKFHGFRNRSWVSLPGNLHLTAFLKCNLKAVNSSAQMMVLSALSSVEAIQIITENIISPKIKWMNDIIVNNSKIGGIITQGRIQGSILQNILLGIGINVNAFPDVARDEVIPSVTSISKELKGKSIELIDFLRTLSAKLIQNFKLIEENSYEILYRKYVEYSTIVDKKVKIISDPISGGTETLFEGIVESISDKLEIKLKEYDELITKGRIVALEN